MSWCGSGVKGETDPAMNSDSATYFLYELGLSFPNWIVGVNNINHTQFSDRKGSRNKQQVYEIRHTAWHAVKTLLR